MDLVVFKAMSTIWLIIKNWWWLPLPFILYNRFLFFWMWYKAEQYDGTVKKIVLEIKIPKEVVKPIKAMEQVIAGFHGIHDVFNWREKWLQGEFQLTFSLEIASVEGKIHFFIRLPQIFRPLVESNVYSQYPEAEITQVEDYSKFIPQGVPNKDWDVFGFDFIASRKSAYPLRTYKEFEELKEIVEEKRLDPLSGLLDGMSILNPGEQMWLQIVIKPVREEIPWQEEGREIVNELVHREKEETSMPSIFKEAADVLISGKQPGQLPEEEKREIIPPEMKLTPGERDVVKAIEDKISKFGFDTNIRCLYLAKKEVFLKPKARMFYGFFKNISNESLQGLKPWTKTMPKIQWLLKKQRTYLRKRILFRRYQRRFSPLFPHKGGTYVLNTEEIATLYHFPGRAVAPAPAIPRVEAKKREAPSGLPVE